jgi:hypothetical protein
MVQEISHGSMALRVSYNAIWGCTVLIRYPSCYDRFLEQEGRLVPDLGTAGGSLYDRGQCPDV